MSTINTMEKAMAFLVEKGYTGFDFNDEGIESGVRFRNLSGSEPISVEDWVDLVKSIYPSAVIVTEDDLVVAYTEHEDRKYLGCWIDVRKRTFWVYNDLF